MRTDARREGEQRGTERGDELRGGARGFELERRSGFHGGGCKSSQQTRRRRVKVRVGLGKVIVDVKGSREEKTGTFALR